MKESKAKIEYDGLLESGMFWEFYPDLTGFWDLDKIEFELEYARLCKMRKSTKI